MEKSLLETVESLNESTISVERKKELQQLVDFIRSQQRASKKIAFNFVCTHNSRRSQFAQFWATVMGHYFGIEVGCFSGGVEINACNERVIHCLKQQGFEVQLKPNGDNPIYEIRMKEIVLGNYFSKIYDDKSNPKQDFAAIMVCDHADQNCPFIPGATARIPLRYKDPKEFDNSPQEELKYYEKSIEIATELKYVFSSL